MLEILDPFEITCADPSRIRKYVRNQRHISLEKNLISLRCTRTIGAFGHELRFDLGRVLFCDNVFKGGWVKYVYVKLLQLFVSNMFALSLVDVVVGLLFVS